MLDACSFVGLFSFRLALRGTRLLPRQWLGLGRRPGKLVRGWRADRRLGRLTGIKRPIMWRWRAKFAGSRVRREATRPPLPPLPGKRTRCAWRCWDSMCCCVRRWLGRWVVPHVVGTVVGGLAVARKWGKRASPALRHLGLANFVAHGAFSTPQETNSRAGPMWLGIDVGTIG
jgi:hypothetical protein